MSKKNLLIAGNWKMNGSTHFTETLLSQLVSASLPALHEVVVFPPYPYLALTQNILKNTNIKWGAQDVSTHAPGAYTGEVAASMLADLGCRYVIVGHSERRAYHHEQETEIAKKCEMVFQQNMTPILCIGETQAERDQSLTYQVLEKQLSIILNSPVLAHCVLAYEPVWAIGTGKTAQPDEAQAAHAFIRHLVEKKEPSLAQKIRILYGGSVNPSNATALFNMPDINGGLIGGASLKAEDFISLCKV